MSGGYFNYNNDNAAREIFGSYVEIKCDLSKRQEDAKEVAKNNPLEDREISELAYDLFCLLHSYDWYKSSDTSFKDYKDDVEFFKTKWLYGGRTKRINFLVDRAIDRIKTEADAEISALKEMKWGE